MLTSSRRPSLGTALRHTIMATLAVVTLTASYCPGFTGPDDDESGSPLGGSGSGQYWKRNDGAEAYLHLSGSVAKACAGGTETVGTYNASEPSMTFVIQGTSLKFPLEYRDGALLVGVPDQGVNTNTATWYVKSTSYPCGGSGGGDGDGDGDGGGTTNPDDDEPVIGTVNVRVYKPTGACQSTGTKAFLGVLGGPTWHKNSYGWTQGYSWPVSGSNNHTWAGSSSTYYDYKIQNTTGITWELWPDRSSWPNYCTQRGEATIGYKGQVVNVTIRFE